MLVWCGDQVCLLMKPVQDREGLKEEDRRRQLERREGSTLCSSQGS